MYLASIIIFGVVMCFYLSPVLVWVIREGK